MPSGPAKAIHSLPAFLRIIPPSTKPLFTIEKTEKRAKVTDSLALDPCRGSTRSYGYLPAQGILCIVKLVNGSVWWRHAPIDGLLHTHNPGREASNARRAEKGGYARQRIHHHVMDSRAGGKRRPVRRFTGSSEHVVRDVLASSVLLHAS